MGKRREYLASLKSYPQEREVKASISSTTPA
jgi:hypothetical protein